MAQWMGKVGFELQPLADYVLQKIKRTSPLKATLSGEARCRELSLDSDARSAQIGRLEVVERRGFHGFVFGNVGIAEIAVEE